MKYLSIDIETTGLDPNTCQVIEFAAVLEDTTKPEVPVEDLPCFRRLLMHETLRGEPYALALNWQLIKRMTEAPTEETCRAGMLGTEFRAWMKQHGLWKLGDKDGQVVVAGKNFPNFDLRFLRRLDGFSTFHFHHRFLDPTMYYVASGDSTPPSSKTIMERAGITGDVAHTALEDARCVIHMIRVGMRRDAPTTGTDEEYIKKRLQLVIDAANRFGVAILIPPAFGSNYTSLDANNLYFGRK